MKYPKLRSSSAFTLVELLLVVIIVGILGSIALVVLNPQRQINKSREAVLRSNMAKVCAAMTACMGGQSSTPSTTNCDAVGRSEIPVVGTEGDTTIDISEPEGATYVISVNGPPTNGNSYVAITGTVPLGTDNCVYRCVTSNNFSAQNVDGASRDPGQVYAVTTDICLLD